MAKFPAASVAFHVTIVSPTGNKEGASLFNEYIPTASSTIGACTSTILSFSEVASTIIVSFGMIFGAIVSTTDTVCTALALFPAASIAVHVTIVSPTGNKEGALFSTETIPTASVASATPIATVFVDGSTAS